MCFQVRFAVNLKFHPWYHSIVQDKRLVLSSLCFHSSVPCLLQRNFFLYLTHPCGHQPWCCGWSRPSCRQGHPWPRWRAKRGRRRCPWRLTCWPPWMPQHQCPGRSRRRSWRRSVQGLATMKWVKWVKLQKRKAYLDGLHCD
jgi:hypothetical protein